MKLSLVHLPKKKKKKKAHTCEPPHPIFLGTLLVPLMREEVYVSLSLRDTGTSII